MASYVPFSSSELNNGKKTFDIGVVIALPEEFDLFLKYISESEGWKTRIKQFWDAGHTFWSIEMKTEGCTIDVVAYLVAEMGTEYTGVATNMLVEKWHVPFIVNIGVTGSLDKDVNVGSIVLPTQITHYTANWKALDNAGNGREPEFVIGTRAFATNRVIISQFANFLATTEYKEWQTMCSVNKGRTAPKLHLGHVASGNMVVDSELFKKQLKSSDRKLIACEMETAGFMIAEQFLQASAKAVSQFISLRAISDMASDKERVESAEAAVFEIASGNVILSRELAMRNVTMLFLFLIKKKVINAEIDAQLELLTDIVKQLNSRKKETKARTKDENYPKDFATFKKLGKTQKVNILRACCVDVNVKMAVKELDQKGEKYFSSSSSTTMSSKRQHGQPLLQLEPSKKRARTSNEQTNFDDIDEDADDVEGDNDEAGDSDDDKVENEEEEEENGEAMGEGEGEEEKLVTVPVGDLSDDISTLSNLIREHEQAKLTPDIFHEVRDLLKDATAKILNAVHKF
jgi:nucleoside phosphorylase